MTLITPLILQTIFEGKDDTGNSDVFTLPVLNGYLTVGVLVDSPPSDFDLEIRSSIDGIHFVNGASLETADFNSGTYAKVNWQVDTKRYVRLELVANDVTITNVKFVYKVN